MESSLDFSIKSAIIFSMSLDKIIFSGLDAGKDVTLTIEIATVSDFSAIKDQFDTVYYADNNGYIYISGLGRIWNAHILSYRMTGISEETPEESLKRAIYVRFTYNFKTQTVSGNIITTTYHTATCMRRIYYSRKESDQSPSDLSSWWPILPREKKTYSGLKELLYLISESTCTIKAGVASLLNDQTAWTEKVITPPSAGDMSAIDVSPDIIKTAVLGNTTAQMLYYEIMLYDGDALKDTVRYILDTRNYPQKTEFIYLNFIGAYETVLFTGQEELDPERNVNYGYTGDEYTALDLEMNNVYNTYSGYCNKTIMSQIRDMLESPLIWVWTGTDYRKVTVTDIDYKRITPTSEMYNVKVTWRYAEDIEHTDKDILPWDTSSKVFSHPPFDRTFS
jgi:hypothetical protein